MCTVYKRVMYAHLALISAVVEVVPHLNAVLSRMITQLGAIKHENMQWVFSYGQYWFPVPSVCGENLSIQHAVLKVSPSVIITYIYSLK